MPRQTHSAHILELAKRGAEHRYQELKAEIDQLVKYFPHLMADGRKVVAAAESTVQHVVDAEIKQVRKGWKMSAAAKKAVSERMKKYWAARRKAKPSR